MITLSEGKIEKNLVDKKIFYNFFLLINIFYSDK